MDSIERTLADVLKAIAEEDSDRLSKLSIDLSILLVDYDIIPSPFFDSILNVIRRPEFAGMQGSYSLLNNVLRDATMFTDAQKQLLVQTLEEIYPELEDFTVCMVALEIITDLSSERISYGILRRLKKTSRTIPRAMVAYGLYYFIRNCRDDTWTKNAATELEQMQDDPSREVRIEANDAISKLRR